MSSVATARRAGLLRLFGTGFGVAVLVGNTIGSGILRAPGEAAAAMGSVSGLLAAWVIGALYALLGANAVAELGTRIPRSGGQYVFAAHAFGPYAGFVAGWSDWLGTSGSAAAAAAVAAESIALLFPAVAFPARVAAVAILVLCAIPQWISMRSGGRTQEITSLVKGLLFAALIAACFLAAPAAPASEGLVRTHALPIALVIALQSIIFTFDGWTGPIYFSEELRDRKSIARSMFGGLALVIVIYLLVNLAFLRVLGIERLASSPLAATTAAEVLAGAAGGRIVTTITLVSLISAVIAFLLMAPRVIYAMAADGLTSIVFSDVTRGGTPRPALAVSTAGAIAFAATGTFTSVVAVLTFFFVALYAMSFAALLKLRATEPAPSAGWRAIGHPWTTALALLASLSFLALNVVTDPWHAGAAITLLALSYPAYRLRRTKRTE